jgi:hypothetical protein
LNNTEKSIEEFRQILACKTALMGCYIFWCAFGEDGSSTLSTFRAKVKNPISGFDYIQMMFDNDDAVALFSEFKKDVDEQFHIRER